MDIIALIQNNLLSIVIVGLTLILFYYYLIDKESGNRLGKKYRDSIYEAQSKVFLNATQYLISGNRDLAIKEFLNAVDINRETIDTYFALGQLFRSNGEIGKAISIHRSIISRQNIQEITRVKALKELAIDFDKGGFIDKAIDTYKDVLKIDRNQSDVVSSLCRIFEDIGDWDQAYNYRMLLSQVSRKNQSDTISHILVQKSKQLFFDGDIPLAVEILDEAFQSYPSVSAKILRLRIFLTAGDLEGSKNILIELLHESPVYTSFIFESLNDSIHSINIGNTKKENHSKETYEEYLIKLKLLKDYFLKIDDNQIFKSPAVVLTKLRLLREKGLDEEAFIFVESWIKTSDNVTETLRIEFIKMAIKIGKDKDAISQTKLYLDNISRFTTKHYCSNCGYNSDNIFWRCPQCHEWETIKFRWKI